MRIRTYLSLMALTILVPILTAAVLAIEKIRLEERDSALRGLRETARAVSLIVDREVQSSLSALAVLGNSEHLETRNFSAFYSQAVALNSPNVWTLLLDSSGQQVLNTRVPFGTAAPPPVSLARVTKVLASRKPLVTGIFTGPVSGLLVTSVFVPAKAAGGDKFVVAQAFGVAHWKNVALREEVPPNYIIAVIDPAGTFIARSHKADELVGKPARPELVAAAATAESGLIRHNTVEGIESYDAFTHSSLTGWTVAVAAPVPSIDGAANRAVQLASAGLLLAIAMAFAVALAFGRRLIRAITEAGGAAISLGHGKKPAVVDAGIFEFNALNRAMVDASELLDTERVSRLAAETERQRLLQNETAARVAAEEQNVAKDKFLAMLGHELRNPLAAISGAVALLKLGTLDPARSRHFLNMIERQNRHLNFIVDDLLDVSRLLAGKIVLAKKTLDLAASITSCIEAIKSSDRAAGYTIDFHGNTLWVDADPVRIEQILNNLINNALKFSPAGSVVSVRLREEAGRAVVSVRDQGTGMSAELLPQIFEPFVQGPPSADRTLSGLGIGLALVKQLLELHGGEVRAESDGPGRGSTFTFSMPCAAAPPAPEHQVRAAIPVAGRKLVLVEDNDDARTTMAELLRALHHEVVEVTLGREAAAVVAAEKPDVVVVDIGLPDIDGYEVARSIRGVTAAIRIPLIALTGYGQLHDKQKALDSGFDAHLVKPVDVHALVQTIEALLATRKR